MRCPHRLWVLDTWSPADSAVWGDLGCSLAEDVCHCRWALRVYSLSPFHFPPLLHATTGARCLSFLLLVPCLGGVLSLCEHKSRLPSITYQRNRKVNTMGRESEAAPVLLAFMLS